MPDELEVNGPSDAVIEPMPEKPSEKAPEKAPEKQSVATDDIDEIKAQLEKERKRNKRLLHKLKKREVQVPDITADLPTETVSDVVKKPNRKTILERMLKR